MTMSNMLWNNEVGQRLSLFVASLFPDELYIKTMFKRKLGYSLDLKQPKTFNEKLNWLKLYDRNPFYSQLADKFEVKKVVAERLGKEHVVQNYGCWNDFDKIDWNSLPEKFVLKCTHDSSGVTICKGKNLFDISKARKRIKQSLSLKHSSIYREWPYQNITPRIIADQLLDDHSGKELNDYKFWCFNGEPKYMYCTVKAKDIYENFYDMDFNPVDIDHGFERHKPEFSKPAAFDEMKELARKMASGIPFVRVDFFYVDGRVYFGECTFYDWGGMQPFKSYEQDLELGKLLNLPTNK